MRTGHGDAVMAAQRQFQPASHRYRVDRGDHGLGRCLDRAEHRVQRGRGKSLGRIEFANVGTAGKRAAGADQDDGGDFGIVLGGIKALDDPLRNA